MADQDEMAGLVKTMTGQQILAPARPASPSAQTPQVVQLVVGKAEKADASMDGLQFASSVIGSIAWPVIVLTFLVLFRANIRKLIDRLRKASIAGNSIDLSLDDGDAQMEVLEAIAPPRAFSGRSESMRDSHRRGDLIHGVGWMEAGMDGQAIVDGSSVASAGRG